jgi:ornithine cyclodeaminase/alanine dehydrogenase-like protein (mu-crystallin family)
VSDVAGDGRSSVLVLSEHEVRELLDMESCIDAMADVLAALARGELFQPLRSIARPANADGFIGLMPAHRAGASAAYALKEIVVTPTNPARFGIDAHQGAVLLHDGETGQLVAVLNASPVTEIRTAAVSAVATRALARKDAERVAILGAGVQARAHAEAMRAVLDDPEIRIWARNPDSAQALAAEVGAIVAPSADAALLGAEVVCTTTAATEPVVELRWLAEGAHVNAVGACIPTARELDAATVAAAAFFVDRRESALHEAGDYVLAVAEGLVGPDHIRAELGEVLAGLYPGRQDESALTVFESLGIAVEDLAAADLVVRRARERGAGTEVPF